MCVGKKRGWQNPTSFIWQCVSDGADSVSGWHGLTLCWMMTLPRCAQPRHQHQHRLITFDSTSVTLAFALRAYEFSIKTWNLLFSKTKAPDLVYVHMVLVVLVFVLICGGGRCGAVLAECDVLWARKELWQMTRYITSRCSPAQPGPCITAATRWPATTTNQSRATELGAQSGLDSW